MRLTLLCQYARGVAHHNEAAGKSLLAELERIKWLLWPGNQHRARETISFFLYDVDGLEVDYPNLSKFVRAGLHGVTTRFVQNCTLRREASDHPFSLRVSDAGCLCERPLGGPRSGLACSFVQIVGDP